MILSLTERIENIEHKIEKIFKVSEAKSGEREEYVESLKRKKK